MRRLVWLVCLCCCVDLWCMKFDFVFLWWCFGCCFLIEWIVIGCFGIVVIFGCVFGCLLLSVDGLIYDWLLMLCSLLLLFDVVVVDIDN